MKFYKVRNKATGQFYDPNKPGNRLDPMFSNSGKKYYGKLGLTNARKAVEFCESDVNSKWGYNLSINGRPKIPSDVEIIEYEESVQELGIVQ